VHARTIDNLAIVRTQRRNEDSNDEQGRVDHVLATSSFSQWWQSA
jgi:hypothetical protein